MESDPIKMMVVREEAMNPDSQTLSYWIRAPREAHAAVLAVIIEASCSLATCIVNWEEVVALES